MMRKITSKHQEEKKKKRNQWIVSSVLIFVLFFSVLGFAFSDFSSNEESNINNNNSNSINYNGFKFTEQNGFWILNQNNLIFRYNPNEIPKINSKLKNLNNYNGKPLYIYSENALAGSEIYKNLAQSVERMQNACFERKGCDKNLPIKTCESNFIIIKEGNEKIVQDNNCVFITGKAEDLTKLTDAFLFKMLGIES